MRMVLLGILLMWPMSSVAQTSADEAPPSAEQMKKDLFGVHLFGTVGFGELWNECIEPDGDTLYTIGDQQERGKATIPEDGTICFNYGGPDHCFRAYLDRDGYVFKGGGTIWKTTKIRDNVEVCLLSDMIG